jgi:hypothetical protein
MGSHYLAISACVTAVLKQVCCGDPFCAQEEAAVIIPLDLSWSRL